MLYTSAVGALDLESTSWWRNKVSKDGSDIQIPVPRWEPKESTSLSLVKQKTFSFFPRQSNIKRRRMVEFQERIYLKPDFASAVLDASACHYLATPPYLASHQPQSGALKLLFHRFSHTFWQESYVPLNFN